MKSVRTAVLTYDRSIMAGLFLMILAVALFLAGPAQSQEIPKTFADVAAGASSAVVNISTVKVVKGVTPGFQMPPRPGQPQDPFEDFFDRFFGQQGPHRDRKESSLGSGFIIDKEGYIITNNHVIEGADEIMVRLDDEREFPGEVIGRDPKTDLALIKVKADTDLGFLPLGDSSKMRIGDWVVAIGNPFGLDHTVTAGILSARGRVIGSGPYDDFLQTDASINPGNSGGPLLNMQGEVIGINSAIIAGGTGIGFAIPVNLAKTIVDQLKAKGRVVRGWLGVMIQKVTPELAKSFGLDEERGALVGDVTQGGPADKAGIQRGDVIVSFGGQPIEDFSTLPGIVANTTVGKKVEVVLFRNGKEMKIEVEVGELKDDMTASVEPETMAANLGLTVKELTPEMAEGLGLTEVKGVVVTGIEGGSAAEEAGLNAGDVILEINRQAVDDLAAYNRVMSDVKKEDTVLFLIKRGTNTLFFTVDAG